MRISSALIGTGAALLFVVGAAQIEQALPTRWTHDLNSGCSWDRKPWVGAASPLIEGGLRVGWWIGLPGRLPTYGEQDRDAARACFMRRGGWGRPEDLHIVMTRWPTPAERAAWK